MIAAATLVLVIAALAAIALALRRIVAGPTNADRIVALDMLLAIGIALCVAAALRTGRMEFVDVGIGLALIGFVGTIGWARLIERAPRRPETKR